MSFEHVGLAALRSYASFTIVSDVNSLVGVKRCRLTFLDQSDLDGRDVSARSVHHPSVDSVPHCAIIFSVSLLSTQKKGFFFSEDVNFLDSTVYFFTWLDEEAARASDKDFLSELILSLLVLGVEDVAEFIFSQDGDGLALHELLIDIKDMGGRVSACDKPLLSSLAFDIVVVNKSLLSFKQEGSNIIDYFAINCSINYFIYAWDVETLIADQPFLSGISFAALCIFCLTCRSYSDCLVCLNSNGTDHANNVDLDAWQIDLRSEFKPLITSYSFELVLPTCIGKVTESF